MKSLIKYNGCRHVFSYKDVVAKIITPNYDTQGDVYPTIYPNWDHSPRGGKNTLIIVGSKPSIFEIFLCKIIDVVKVKNEQHQIVFLKSWNEWGEGNYVEPDKKYGVFKFVEKCGF